MRGTTRKTMKRTITLTMTHHSTPSSTSTAIHHPIRSTRWTTNHHCRLCFFDCNPPLHLHLQQNAAERLPLTTLMATSHRQGPIVAAPSSARRKSPQRIESPELPSCKSTSSRPSQFPQNLKRRLSPPSQKTEKHGSKTPRSLTELIAWGFQLIKWNG
jgi:hypothetical protein